jgi:CRISPR/Cas system-associated exonuclease Cas4 (RecB family)
VPKLSQNLTITYSNQRARDLKTTASLNPLDRVVTLEGLIVELFEQNNFQIILDDVIGSSIVYKIIQEHHIGYFSYLQSDAESLQTIYSFIVKCNRNDVAFDTLIKGDKLEAIEQINTFYQAYKKSHNAVDIADVEAEVLRSWSEAPFAVYNDIFIDDFNIGDICFIKSKKQEQILEKLNKCKKLEKTELSHQTARMIQPSNVVFDAIDEVKTALKIARKLLEEGVSAEEILIVASDIAEYAPLFKLFLAEYGLQGYSSLGTPLSSYHLTSEPKVQKAMDQYKSQIQSLEVLYKKLGLTLSATARENIKASMKILDEKIGIELTEPNQLVGLHRTYKHIVFMGTDINHFPPSAKDNFLYTYDNDVRYFYANNYFTSSQTQLYELGRLSENLYIITASYSGKRELSSSILLDGRFDDTIDLLNIQSISELGLHRQTIVPEDNTKAYYESITNEAWSKFDGKEVDGIHAPHLSASQINKYLTCPLAYFYTNKLGVETPRQTQEGFDAAEQGSLMHLCYELFGKKIKETKNTSLDKEALYALMYDTSIEAYEHKQTVEPRGKEKLVENIHHQIFLSNLQAGLKDERDVGLLAKFVDYYIQSAEEFEYFQNTEFEKAFALDDELKPYEIKDKFDENYFIRGFIDRFDNLENSINVIDYKSKKISAKSGKHKETQEKIDELKDVQLALYILYAKQQYPGKNYYSSMISFKGDNTVAHFGELLHDQFDEAYETKLKGLIFDTKESIKKGEFGFDNSDEKACGYCDMKFICHEGVLDKNNHLTE